MSTQTEFARMAPRWRDTPRARLNRFCRRTGIVVARTKTKPFFPWTAVHPLIADQSLEDLIRRCEQINPDGPMAFGRTRRSAIHNLCRKLALPFRP